MLNANANDNAERWTLNAHRTTPGLKISKSLFTSAHLRLFPTYASVLILRSLQVTNADNHGTSYAHPTQTTMVFQDNTHPQAPLSSSS